MAISTIGNSGTSTPLPTAPQGAAAAVVAAAASEPTIQQQQPTTAQLNHAVEAMKQMVEAKAPNSLSFSVDKSTGKTIVRVTDVQTGEMVRQIPSEEMLEIARSIDRMQGMLLKQKA